MEEHRQDLRAEVAVEVHYRSAQEFRSAYSANISGGGIFLRTPEPLPLNHTVRMRFTLPGVPRPFECHGLVVWAIPAPKKSVLPAGMGIKFLDLAAEAKTLIDAFVTTTPGPGAPPQPEAGGGPQRSGKAPDPGG